MTYILAPIHNPIVHVVIYNKLDEKLLLNKNHFHIINYNTEQHFDINYVVYFFLWLLKHEL